MKQLHTWIVWQREQYKKGELREERRYLLDDIGFFNVNNSATHVMNELSRDQTARENEGKEERE